MVCLSFDIEEFDAPREWGMPIAFERQLDISATGTNAILAILEGFGVRATFFCTANFAEHRPRLIKRIAAAGHEIASHSYYHSKFSQGDLLASRLKLQEISGCQVVGYRSPRMGAVDYAELEKAGYKYDSSINPTYLPGRYNNSSKPYTIYNVGGLREIPSSVSPLLSNWGRIPLFWLAIHNLPLDVYKFLADRCYHKSGFLNIYSHPWEYTEELKDFRPPFYVARNSGARMIYRMSSLIAHFKEKGHRFGTLSELIDERH